MGMTLHAFGKFVDLPWQTIAKYETGRMVPPSDRLLKIAHACRRAPEPFQFEKVARAAAREAA